MRSLLAVLAFLAALAIPGATAVANLTAGDIDDNLNWPAYLVYRARNDPHLTAGLPDLSDRITLTLQDAAGEPQRNVRVTVRAGQDSVTLTSAFDGTVRLFPSFDGLRDGLLTLTIGGVSTTLDPQLGDVTLTVDGGRVTQTLDLLFVVDTTGSMGDEMLYLAREITWIVGAVKEAHPQADLRFGLILYKDVHDDAYVVRDLGFTDELQDFQGWMKAQTADGGGDFPEAMDQAMGAAADAGWRSGASKLMFLVADAPPHDEDVPAFLAAVGRARLDGVRIHSLAASGVEDNAQAVLRAASALTQGRYAWLTDDSGIGNSHAEPTVPCYVVTELKGLVVRLVATELAGKRVEPTDDLVIREVGDYEDGVCYSLKPPVTPPVLATPEPTVPEPTLPEPTVPEPTAPEPTLPVLTTDPVIPDPTLPTPTGPTPAEPTLPAPTPTLPSPSPPSPTTPEPTLPPPTPTTPEPTLPVPTTTLPILTVAPTMPAPTATYMVAATGTAPPPMPFRAAIAAGGPAPGTYAAGGGGGALSFIGASAAPSEPVGDWAMHSYGTDGDGYEALRAYAAAETEDGRDVSLSFSEKAFDRADKAALDDVDLETSGIMLDPFDSVLPRRGAGNASATPVTYMPMQASMPAPNPYTGMAMLAVLGGLLVVLRRR